MKKTAFFPNQVLPKGQYITTSKLARLCGVSRFTIINWVKTSKIKSVKTIGGHRRIPISEAINVLETLQADRGRREGSSELTPHCWEFAETTNYDNKCKDCITYKKKIGYCFLVVKQLGKEWTHCKGNCSDCAYFNEIFSKIKVVEKPNSEESPINKSGTTAGRKNLFNNISYGIGCGALGIKEKIGDIKHGFRKNISKARNLTTNIKQQTILRKKENDSR